MVYGFIIRISKRKERMRNSTIRTKSGNCEICGKFGPLTKKQCQTCYWNGIRLRSVQKQEEKELNDDEDLQTLVTDLDFIFSKHIRLKYANNKGLVQCYTCPTIEHYNLITNGHYISRSHMYLRWDERNCRPQCELCNNYKRGNIGIYTKNLELEQPGITEILMEEGHMIYKWSRNELKSMISDYAQKNKQLLQYINTDQ